ncbi:V-type ATP synthase subunit I [Chloroflexota bacterium]
MAFSDVLNKVKTAPIVFNKSEPMRRLRLVTTSDEAEGALKHLHELGVLDVEQSAELTPEDVSAVEAEREKVRESLRRVDGLLSYLPESETVDLAGDVQQAYERPADETHKEIELVHGKLDRISEKTIKLREELKSIVEVHRYLVPLAERLDISLSDLSYSGGYLYAGVYIFAAGSAESFSKQVGDYIFDTTIVPMGEEAAVYTVAKAESKKKVDLIADGLGGKTLQIPQGDAALKSYITVLDEKVPSLEAELEDLTAELQRNVKENLPALALLKTVLAAEDDRLAVLETAYQAKYVTVIEGWLPETDAKEAVSKIEEGIKHVYTETRKPHNSEEPPSKLKNVKGIKPFEVIVNLFSVPKYGGWDPTPIVAYFFAFFFGVMFADVVYGIILILCVKFLLHKLVDDPTTDGFQLFKRVLYTSGVVGLVFGALSGSYLGNINVEPLGWVAAENEGAWALIPSVQEWMGDPLKFLIFSLYVGLVHINIAFAISLYKGIKQRDKAEIISKVGMFVFEFGIPVILTSILGLHIPFIPAGSIIYQIFTYMMIIGIIMIIAGAVMKQGGLGGIFWLFDLTGLLGDVMSYARLAGVGMATYQLAVAFNSVARIMSDMIGGEGGFIPGVAGGIIGTIVLVLILFGAHIINLFLGVLSGFVHSLRLCFAEFLMKFYDGGGREYKPFKLKTPKSVIIGE